MPSFMQTLKCATAIFASIDMFRGGSVEAASIVTDGSGQEYCKRWMTFGANNGGINSNADLSSNGWSYSGATTVISSTTACDGTTIDPGDFMAFMFNSYTTGYVQQELPADGNVAIVKWASAYTSSKGNPWVYLTVGGDTIASHLSTCSWSQGEMQTTAVSYDEGDYLRLSEGRGVFLAWSVDICGPSAWPSQEPTSGPTYSRPTPRPTQPPTTLPSLPPSPLPTKPPMPEPTPSPTPLTWIPTIVPTAVPTPLPSLEPSPVPVFPPTALPRPLPSPLPTATPSPPPTVLPTSPDTVTVAVKLTLSATSEPTASDKEILKATIAFEANVEVSNIKNFAVTTTLSRRRATVDEEASKQHGGRALAGYTWNIECDVAASLSKMTRSDTEEDFEAAVKLGLADVAEQASASGLSQAVSLVSVSADVIDRTPTPIPTVLDVSTSSPTSLLGSGGGNSSAGFGAASSTGIALIAASCVITVMCAIIALRVVYGKSLDDGDGFDDNEQDGEGANGIKDPTGLSRLGARLAAKWQQHSNRTGSKPVGEDVLELGDDGQHEEIRERRNSMRQDMSLEERVRQLVEQERRLAEDREEEDQASQVDAQIAANFPRPNTATALRLKDRKAQAKSQTQESDEKGIGLDSMGTRSSVTL